MDATLLSGGMVGNKGGASRGSGSWMGGSDGPRRDLSSPSREDDECLRGRLDGTDAGGVFLQQPPSSGVAIFASGTKGASLTEPQHNAAALAKASRPELQGTPSSRQLQLYMSLQ